MSFAKALTVSSTAGELVHEKSSQYDGGRLSTDMSSTLFPPAEVIVRSWVLVTLEV